MMVNNEEESALISYNTFYSEREVEDDVDDKPIVGNSKRKRIFCLVSCIFLYIAEGVNVSVTGPFFPNEAEAKGVSQTMVGLISSTTNIALGLVSIVMLFVTTEKNKKGFFYVGVILSSLMCVSFGEAIKFDNQKLFITTCFITRFLMGSGCACIWATGAPILLPLFPKQGGKIFGLLEFCAGFGQMIGPPVGSLLYSFGGYTVPFWVAGSIEFFAGILCIASISTLDQNSEKPKKKRKIETSVSVLHGSTKCLNSAAETKFSKSSLKFISRPGLILVTLPALCVLGEMGFFQVALAPHLLSEYDIDGTTSGHIFLIHAALSAITCALYGILVDRGFASFTFVTCVLSTSVGFAILALPAFFTFSHSKSTLFGGLSILGLTANGGFIPGYFLFEKIGLMNDIDTPSKVRIYVCAWMNSCYAVANGCGQVFVGGIFFEHFDFYYSCLLMSVLTLVASLLGSIYLCKAGLMKKVLQDGDVVKVDGSPTKSLDT